MSNAKIEISYLKIDSALDIKHFKLTYFSVQRITYKPASLFLPLKITRSDTPKYPHSAKVSGVVFNIFLHKRSINCQGLQANIA